MIVSHAGWIAPAELHLDQGHGVGRAGAHNPGEDAGGSGIDAKVGWRKRDGKLKGTKVVWHGSIVRLNQVFGPTL
jgi:hypothetical protein